MFDKESWPSSEKLERLKEEGQTAITPAGIVLFSAAAIFFYYLNNFDSTLDTLKKLFNQTSLFTESETPELLKNLITTLILYPALFTSALIIFLTAFQRKFVFRLSFLSPQAERFSPLANLKKLKPLEQIGKSVIIFCSGFIALAPLVYLLFRFMLKELDILTIAGLLKTYIAYGVILAVALAVISYAFAVGIFYLRQRMTREELQMESAGKAKDYINPV